MLRCLHAAVAVFLASSALGAETLTVAVFPKLDEAVRLVLPAWNQRHPDVPIRLMVLGYADHHNRLATQLAGTANVPDVVGIETSYLGRFKAAGVLENLAASPYLAGQLQPRFVHYAFAQTTEADGRILALPADIGPGTLFYRKDLFDRCGIQESGLTDSWAGLLAAGRKLKAKTGAYLVANPRELKELYLHATLKEGEGLYFDQNGKSLVESDRFVQAFELARAARKAGIDARINTWTNEWAAMLRNGKIAIVPSGSWFAGPLASWIAPSTAGHWRVTDLPVRGNAAWGGSFYAIPKQAGHKALAWELIQLLTDRNNQLNALRAPALQAFPALNDAQQDPIFDSPMSFFGGQTALQVWRHAAQATPATHLDRNDPVAVDLVDAALDSVLVGGKDIRAALAKARAQIELRTQR